MHIFFVSASMSIQTPDFETSSNESTQNLLPRLATIISLVYDLQLPNIYSYPYPFSLRSLTTHLILKPRPALVEHITQVSLGKPKSVQTASVV